MDIDLDMSNSTVLLGITSDTLGLACEILRSLNYCYRMSRSFTITFAFLFIQEVAYSCLDRGSIEAEWAAAHGWAELVDSHDIQDANLLLRLLPMGKIKSESATVPVMEPLTTSWPSNLYPIGKAEANVLRPNCCKTYMRCEAAGLFPHEWITSQIRFCHDRYRACSAGVETPASVTWRAHGSTFVSHKVYMPRICPSPNPDSVWIQESLPGLSINT